MANIKLAHKKAELEVLEGLHEKLDAMEHDILTEWAPTGEVEQAKDWRTGELLWLDDEHTQPKMRDVYGSMPKSLDALEETERLKLQAINNLRDYLDKRL